MAEYHNHFMSEQPHSSAVLSNYYCFSPGTCFSVCTETNMYSVHLSHQETAFLVSHDHHILRMLS